MNCPIDHELLVRYWAADVSETEADAIDEHLFTCATCFAAASQIAALASGLSAVLPPVALERDLSRAKARGVRTVPNDFLPGEPKEAWLPRDADVLVHRLLADLTSVAKVSLDVITPDGTALFSFDDVPFDPAAGAVLIACQRHFAETFPPDVTMQLRSIDREGREAIRSYSVLHRFA